jgi:LmbE family N-acetylglucosaminyl deacetylase
MLNLNFGENGPATVLCLGAHCDDIEIGCGGALAVLAERFPALKLRWAVFSGDDTRSGETRAAAARLLPASVDCSIEIMAFRQSYFPWEGAGIKDQFERLKAAHRPDLIFTHALADRHQDHRLLAELTWNSFRDHLVLEYEIPKFEGDLGHPNLYVPLTRMQVDLKVATLMACFPSQAQRAWFTADTFRALMRLRGLESNAPDGYAEAFHARKLTL